MKTYCFDIDGVLCETTDMDYGGALPKRRVIDSVNWLHDEGNTIKLFTARGSETGIDWRKITEKQLDGWGLRYHELHFGKPAADMYIDDKAVPLEEVMNNG
jgi:hypothetical protein